MAHLHACARATWRWMGSSSAQSALQRERDEVEAGRQKIEQLQAQLAAERRDKSGLQARYDAEMKATANCESKLRERLQRVMTANQQLEQLVEEHDISAPDTIRVFGPSVSQTQHRKAERSVAKERHC